jgi:metal-responsive CopG/Arc/MetJ family transcriptional regulator
MKRSSEKRPRGRPATGREPTATITIPKQTLATIDKLARQQSTTRSEIMRQLIDEALEARKKS